MAPRAKAFYWLNKVVSTIPFSYAFENILSHFTFTMKELYKTF